MSHQPSSESTQLKKSLGRVLVAEDSPECSRFIQWALQRAGLVVDIVENGCIALDKLSQQCDSMNPYTLLLTDIEMPEMDGLELISAIRERDSVLPIIALTSNDRVDYHAAAKLAGCSEQVHKPLDGRQLVTACQKYLA